MCNVAVRISITEMIVVEIEGDGMGIPLAEQEMVFERFYRVLGSTDSTVSSAANITSVGSDIGSGIVREIAARLDATVTVTSPANLASGRGCVFTVKFKAQLKAQT